MLSNNYVRNSNNDVVTTSYGNYSRSNRYSKNISRPHTSSYSSSVNNRNNNNSSSIGNNNKLHKRYEQAKRAYDKPVYRRISQTPKGVRTSGHSNFSFNTVSGTSNNNNNINSNTRMRSTGQNIMSRRSYNYNNPNDNDNEERKESSQSNHLNLRSRLKIRPKTTHTTSLYNKHSTGNNLIASPMNSNGNPSSRFQQNKFSTRRRKNTNTRTESLKWKEAHAKERLDLYGNAKNNNNATSSNNNNIPNNKSMHPVRTSGEVRNNKKKKIFLLKKKIAKGKNDKIKMTKSTPAPSVRAVTSPPKPAQHQHQQQQQHQRQVIANAEHINGSNNNNTNPNQLIGGHISGAVSLQGFKPNKPGWLNQDNALEVPDFGRVGLLSLLGVFDGHGKEGRAVSAFCVQHLSETLIKADIKLPFTPLVGQRLTQAFLDMDSNLRLSVNTTNSGSTAVVLMLSVSHILIAHVGDSRACIGRIPPRNHNNQLHANAPRLPEVMALTSDHKPERPDEHERVNNSGGRVGPSPHNVYADPNTATQRVWSADPSYYGPGLAVSRSFGDSMAHTCGVTTIPEIRLYKIQQYDRWVCIATDGVWDVLSLSDVGDIINSIASRSLKWNPKQAARVIVATARRKWRASPQANGRIDDITAMVIRLNNKQ